MVTRGVSSILLTLNAQTTSMYAQMLSLVYTLSKLSLTASNTNDRLYSLLANIIVGLVCGITVCCLLVAGLIPVNVYIFKKRKKTLPPLSLISHAPTTHRTSGKEKSRTIDTSVDYGRQ